ncbi:MAG: ElyC/SanA/YdcF family protein [Chthoniobacterales bacterium]
MNENAPVVATSRNRSFQRARTLIIWLLLLGIIVVGGSNCWMLESSRSRIFTNTSAIPENEVGLVLGTSSSLRGGYANPFFTGRIAAAAELYHAGKVHHLLLSGDNRKAGYDEPTDMKNALMAKGVPESVLTLDYAGFRTFDSMARAHHVFGLTRVTIISDDFHAPRSIVLGRHFGIDTIAYTSKPIPLRWSTKSRLREILACVNTVLDFTILQTKPHFLGPPEPIR